MLEDIVESILTLMSADGLVDFCLNNQSQLDFKVVTVVLTVLFKKVASGSCVSDTEKFLRFNDIISKVLDTESLQAGAGVEHQKPKRGRKRKNDGTLINQDEPQPSTSATQGQCSPANRKRYEETQSALEIISVGEVSRNSKFGYVRNSTKIKILNIPNNVIPLEWLRKAFEEVVEHLKSSIPENARVGIVIHPEDNPGNKVFLSWRPKDQIHSDVIISNVSRKMQSNETFLTDVPLVVKYDYIEVPNLERGRGRFRANGMSVPEYQQFKKSIITINNKDNSCLPRALVVAIAFSELQFSENKMTKSKFGNIARGRSIQQDLAEMLCFDAGVEIPEEGSGTVELEKFQEHLASKYRIRVYYYMPRGKELYFNGRAENGVKRTLNLMFDANHFSVVKSVKSLFAASYFCDECITPFSDLYYKKMHTCLSLCPCCKESPPCCVTGNVIECTECFRRFYGSKCFNNHKNNFVDGNLTTLCNSLKRCKECLLLITKNRINLHKCGEKYCQICRAYLDKNHLCFMQKYTSKAKSKFLFMFYDFECMQCKSYKNQRETFEHVPNLCVLEQTCYNCVNDEDIKNDCKECGKRQHIFSDEPVKQLIRFLRRADLQKFHTIRLIAHNAGKYDSNFVLKELVEKFSVEPVVIMNGLQILFMSLPYTTISFIDSISFLPMALSSLPKIFGIEDIMIKGYFPHFANTPQLQNYIGPYLDKKLYGCDQMKESSRKVFLDWYNTKANDIFNFESDFLKYCTNDVQILRICCLRFRKDFLAENEIDPLLQVITIAGAASAVFRKKFLKENTIGIIPKGGYRCCDTASKIATKWLIYEERRRGIIIKHSARGREIKIPGCSKVDGYYEDGKEKTVYQFHGCYFHGHECQPGRENTTPEEPLETLDSRRERTRIMTDRLRKKGFKVIEMWECQFKKILATDKELSLYLDKHPLVLTLPLDPRDSFYGGRTNATRLYCKPDFAKGEDIKYLDVKSLYPTVNKYDKYPVGHPVNIRVGADECQGFEKMDGLIKAKILPPKTLYHPVLPLKMHGKLMFVLCRTCAEQLHQGACTHNVDERAFISTYVLDELRLALEMNYVVLEVFEVWEYEVTQYNVKTGEGGIFPGYVNHFARLKEHSSGLPSHLITEKDIDEYIFEFFAKEGIQLDKNLFLKNPGLRYLAKLLLNSLWGRFAMRSNKPKTTIVKNREDLLSLLNNAAIVVNGIVEAGSSAFYVNWENTEEAYEPSPVVNTVIAAYTTAGARIRLFKILRKLGNSVCYYDTDSAIIHHKPGEYLPPTGEYLGDLTDEIAAYGEGSRAIEWVSSGPKSYSIKIAVKGDLNNIVVVTKVKGFSLNHDTSKIVNFQIMKKQVMGTAGSVTINQRAIVRTNDHSVVTKRQLKDFRLTYTKRRRVANFDTLPYGFVE